MAQANKPGDEGRGALLYKSVMPPEKGAKTEPASEMAGESRRRIPAAAGGAGGLRSTAAPASGVAALAQSLGVDPSKLHDVVTVGAKNPSDVMNRAEQLVASHKGRVIPDPQSKAATGQVFFVELPREFAAGFTSELLRNPGTNAPAGEVGSRDESVVALNGPVGSGGGELTGSVETNADVKFLNRLMLNVEVKPPSSTMTVLEIRVVPPAN
jgi:hypothetical protein